MTEEINILALMKGSERYIFLYEDDQKSQLLRTLGRYASNPELSFTWYDAAVLSQKVRYAEKQPSSAQKEFIEDYSDLDEFEL